jgi:hypothetical protein
MAEPPLLLSDELISLLRSPTGEITVPGFELWRIAPPL